MRGNCWIWQRKRKKKPKHVQYTRNLKQEGEWRSKNATLLASTPAFVDIKTNKSFTRKQHYKIKNIHRIKKCIAMNKAELILLNATWCPCIFTDCLAER